MFMRRSRGASSSASWFAACALPELTLETVATIGRPFVVNVPMQSLLLDQWIDVEKFRKLFKLTDDAQFTFYLNEWGDEEVGVRVVPITPGRLVNLISLRLLVLEQARRVDAYAHHFGRLTLLTAGALDDMPFEL